MTGKGLLQMSQNLLSCKPLCSALPRVSWSHWVSSELMEHPVVHSRIGHPQNCISFLAPPWHYQIPEPAKYLLTMATGLIPSEPLGEAGWGRVREEARWLHPPSSHDHSEPQPTRAPTSQRFNNTPSFHLF
jgi:hypothetical protein